MMNSGKDSSNVSKSDVEPWVDELCRLDSRYPMMDFGLEEIMALNPNFIYQPIDSTVYSGSTSGGSPADMAESGTPHEMVTVNNSNPNSSTSGLQTSCHILSPQTQFISNSVFPSSTTCRTTVMVPVVEDQRMKRSMVVQNSPTYATMCQPTTNIGHPVNNHQKMTLDQIRPVPRPVSTIQTCHLVNQNPMRMQYQQPAGTSSHILAPEGGQPRVPEVVIGGQRPRNITDQMSNIAQQLSAEVGFRKPDEFPSCLTWRQYAFGQILQMRESYISELIKMLKRAVQLCTRVENTREQAEKYGQAKVFLEKMITFLNIPSVDMVPKNKDRVYNYMNFIVNYLTSFNNKKGPAFLDDLTDELPPHGSPQINLSPMLMNLGTNASNFNQQVNQPHVHPNQYNPTPNGNMARFNQQPVQHPGSGSSQRGPPVQPYGDVMRSQSMGPPPSPQMIIPKREANMVNFNQNFPSRRQEARTQTQMQRGQFQLGTVNNPILIGGQGQTQRSNLGPKSTTSSHVNVSSSSMVLLTAGGTSGLNFPSTRQVNQQVYPSTRVNANQSSKSDKMKQPMHNSRSLTGSNAGHVLSPLGAILQKPIVLKSTTPPHSVSSSWVVNANHVLTPESIANSPFMLGALSSGQHYTSSGLSSVSSVESEYLPEIPIIDGVFRDQRIPKNRVSDMGPPKTPTPSPVNTPCTEKNVQSQGSTDPHLRLMEAVKTSSPKTLGSSMNDIDSVQKDIDSIHNHGEPTKPIGEEDVNNFFVNYDELFGEGNFDTMYDGEPVNLDHVNIEEELAVCLSQENGEPERKLKRKISTTSASLSEPEYSDFDFDQFLNGEWDIDSYVTSMSKKPKIESNNGAILDEIKKFHSKVLETSFDIDEDSKSMVKGHDEGTIVTCIYRNLCFPTLFKPHEGVSSETRPEFRIKLLVPVNYPASSPTILKGGFYNVLSAPWPELYNETVSEFDRAVRELPEPMSLGDMGRKWDACARSVITEFVQKRGGKSFTIKYGNWESASGSN